MNEAHSDRSIKPSDSVRDVANQDGSVLLDIHQGVCFSLNPVGARIWQMLKAEHSVDQIAGRLSAEFGVAEQQVSQDVGDFVDMLRENNLLKATEPAETGKSARWFRRIFSNLSSSWNGQHQSRR
jgi:hypothetical protein